LGIQRSILISTVIKALKKPASLVEPDSSDGELTDEEEEEKPKKTKGKTKGASKVRIRFIILLALRSPANVSRQVVTASQAVASASKAGGKVGDDLTNAKTKPKKKKTAGEKRVCSSNFS
jgi:hypothetical protein